MNSKVRWGVLGVAAIAREAVIPGMRKPEYGQHAEMVGIASRSLEKARAVAREFQIPHTFGSYEELLNHDAIDAVYIPLPNHLHVPYAIKALEAGKHVLCEKPIALSAAQAEELAQAGRRYAHLKLMEAFMYRHHPQWQWARQVIDEGKIGALRTVHSWFSFCDDNLERIHNRPECGGGGLMDIGCYSISLSRFLFRAEPRQVVGALEYADCGVDCLASAIMEFERGTATFTCSIRLPDDQRMIAWGAKGRLEIEVPFNPPPHRPCRAWLEVEGMVQEVQFPICDQYGIQADLFSRAILDDAPVPTPIEDAVENMRVLDTIVASGQRRAWESCTPCYSVFTPLMETL